MKAFVLPVYESYMERIEKCFPDKTKGQVLEELRERESSVYVPELVKNT